MHVSEINFLLYFVHSFITDVYNAISNMDCCGLHDSNETGQRPRRGRLPTEPGPNVEYSLPGHASPLLASPVRSPPFSSGPSGSDCSDDNAFRSKLNNNIYIFFFRNQN